MASAETRSSIAPIEFIRPNIINVELQNSNFTQTNKSGYLSAISLSGAPEMDTVEQAKLSLNENDLVIESNLEQRIAVSPRNAPGR